MPRTFNFDVDRVTEQLDRILQMELAGVIYYTHYSFMIYGHARIPITAWLRENATRIADSRARSGRDDHAAAQAASAWHRRAADNSPQYDRRDRDRIG